MKKSEIELLKLLEKERKFGEIVSLSKKSKALVSRTLKQLKEKGLIKKVNNAYSLSKNPKSYLILEISKEYPNLLIGKRENVLKVLNKKRSLSEIQALSKVSLKQVLEYLKEFKSYGIVLKEGEKYFLNEEKKNVFELVRILSLEEREPGVIWKRGEEKLKVSRELEEGALTAFSVFPNFGIKIFLPKNDYFFPKRKLEKEEVFVHSLVFASSIQEKILTSLFYVKFKDQMDERTIFSLAKKFGILEKFEEIKNLLEGKESFVSYKEFLEKAREYGIKIERKVSQTQDLIKIFEEVDKQLEKKCKIYLTGGANMVLRGLKISTKDIDIIVSKRDFDKILKVLASIGFSCKHGICEREDCRIDIFKEKILRGYRLSVEIRKRAKMVWKGKNLKVYLLSLEDVFLFKSYASREVDIDDCRILAAQNLNWKVILEECLRQQAKEKKLISLTLLDMLVELKKRYKIRVPIERKLESFVLKRIVLNALKKPKSVKELVYEIQKPESTLRKVLGELLKEGKIKKIKRKKRAEFVRSGKKIH